MKSLPYVLLLILGLCACEEKKQAASNLPDPAILRRKQQADAKMAERTLEAYKDEISMLKSENKRLETELSLAHDQIKQANGKIEEARVQWRAEAEASSTTTNQARPLARIPAYTPAPQQAQVTETEHPYWRTYQGVGVMKGIRADAQKKWGTDYTMVEYHIKNQKEAFEELLEFRKSYDRATKAIITEAENHWGTDYTMVVYRIKEQLGAKSRLDQR